MELDGLLSVAANKITFFFPLLHAEKKKKKKKNQVNI